MATLDRSCVLTPCGPVVIISLWPTNHSQRTDLPLSWSGTRCSLPGPAGQSRLSDTASGPIRLSTLPEDRGQPSCHIFISHTLGLSTLLCQSGLICHLFTQIKHCFKKPSQGTRVQLLSVVLRVPSLLGDPACSTSFPFSSSSFIPLVNAKTTIFSGRAGSNPGLNSEPSSPSRRPAPPSAHSLPQGRQRWH